MRSMFGGITRALAKKERAEPALAGAMPMEPTGSGTRRAGSRRAARPAHCQPAAGARLRRARPQRHRAQGARRRCGRPCQRSRHREVRLHRRCAPRRAGRRSRRRHRQAHRRTGQDRRRQQAHRHAAHETQADPDGGCRAACGTRGHAARQGLLPRRRRPGLAGRCTAGDRRRRGDPGERKTPRSSPAGCGGYRAGRCRALC